MMIYLKRSRLSRGAIAGLSLVLLQGCVTPPTPPTPPSKPSSSDVYTAESTYTKLIRAYPAIHIASAAAPASVRVMRDITYASPGGRDLQLDLFLPAAPRAGKAPGIVFIHGGGWRVGGRAEFAPMAIRLAERGYASVTISYRLADEATFPAGVLDAGAAVRWLRSNAARFAIDPERIAITGGSAGGQIAGLVGVTNADGFGGAEAGGSISGKVQAIVNIDGLSDFIAGAAQTRADPKTRPGPETGWFGGWFRDRAEPMEPILRAASPLTYAGPESPPTLFIGSGVARFSVGREAMVAKLRGAGVVSEVVLLPNTPHSFWLFDPWIEPTVEATAAFLDRVLRPK